MKPTPSLDSIEERLSRALTQFGTPPGGDVTISSNPINSWFLETPVKNMLERRNEWLPAVPAFRDVQSWIEVHWDTERQMQPPAGTVSSGDELGYNGEVQLDPLTATGKLLLAAAVHGAETVAKYAVEFAAHGMIEVRSFYLLKGASVSNATSLDDYCTLLPYREALQKVKAQLSVQPLAGDLHWPPEQTTNVCALETRSFERRGLMADDFERNVSSLLQPVPTISDFEHGLPIYTLAVILGLIWGNGLRVFGSWFAVSPPIAATLPFFRTTQTTSRGTSQILLPLLDARPASTQRPINNSELVELIDKYAALPEKTQHVLNLALRRLRDSTERSAVEDKAVDLSVALEALFMETGEYGNQHDLIARRGSWHFADSLEERDQTRAILKAFYKHRSKIVHGEALPIPTPEVEHQRREHIASLLADVENVVRASLKTMISEGRPQDWEESKDFKTIRRDPPRAETEIPSVKSDSMSWTVAEQKEIDQALEAMWKPEVDNAPSPRSDASPVSHQGIDPEAIERCRQQGTPYVISVPIRLYMAHPKWPKQEGDLVDERTKYYCGKDVERHLQRWHKAAAEKKIYQFELPLEDPTMYLPETFDMWRELLQQGGQPLPQQAP